MSKQFLTTLADCVAAATSRVELLSQIIHAFDLRRIAEIGVWKGDLSAAILQSNPEIEHYLMIDPWRNISGWNKPLNRPTPVMEAAMQRAIDVTEFAASRREILRMTTVEASRVVQMGTYDLVYVDGDHTLRGAIVDVVIGRQMLRDGGVIVGDDFISNPWQHGANFEPTMVFPSAVYLAEAYQDAMMALPYGQFAMLKSPGRDDFTFETADPAYERIELRDKFRPR